MLLWSSGTDHSCLLQEQDTAEAKEALAATAADMAAVTGEQRSLLQQWQAALQSVRQRDSALQVQGCCST